MAVRLGGTWLLVLVALAVLAVVGGVVLWISGGGAGPAEEAPLVTRVVRGPFDHVVVEHGEVESSSSVEVKCAVKSRNSQGTAIIDVIPEGTYVRKGDWLVTLDSSALEEELKQQRIAVNTARAAVIATKAALDQARIAKEEYLEGTFKEQERQILSEILIAEEKLSRAQEVAEYSKRLAALGFQTPSQLRADLFAVQQAQVELDLAKGRLETLREITRKKMLIQFDSDIEAAEAAYQSAQDSYQEELEKLKEIEQQIEACTIRAPADGQVVYANIYSRRGGAEFVVEPGSFVRERQTIIRLPDPTKMQVRATINEARITLVKEGMPVDIRIGAFDPNRVLKGRVVKVNKYAEPATWFSSQVKQYTTLIEILDPPPDLRSGMTAEVSIYVDRRPEALQIPIQAVYEHRGYFFCLVRSGQGEYQTRQIVMDGTSDKFVAVREGLQEGEEVVLNPRRYLHLLQLPDLPERRDQIARGGKEKPKESPQQRRERQLAEARELMKDQFDRLDSDGDGVVTGEELADLPGAVRAAVRQLDHNGDGRIQRHEVMEGAGEPAALSDGSGKGTSNEAGMDGGSVPAVGGGS